MRKHGGTPSGRDKHVTLAAISPPGVPRGRFVGGQQSGLAGCKLAPLFKCGASSRSSQRLPTYLPGHRPLCALRNHHNQPPPPSLPQRLTTLPTARHSCTEGHWDGYACSRPCLPG